jgi:hypothetical protein
MKSLILFASLFCLGSNLYSQTEIPKPNSPDIVILEERRPSGQHPITASPVDRSWNQRDFSNQPIPRNDFVTLNGSNFRFLRAGTYLISASAPAVKTGKHKLCFREAKTGAVKITGTSEYSAAVPIRKGGSYGVATRSTLLGVLVVDANNIAVEYSLDHWIENNTGGLDALGWPSGINKTNGKVDVDEVYAQIVIQKIK